VLGFWQEVRENALVELGLTDVTALQELFTSAIERSMKKRKEGRSILVQDLARLVVQRAVDGHTLKNGVHACHGGIKYVLLCCACEFKPIPGSEGSGTISEKAEWCRRT